MYSTSKNKRILLDNKDFSIGFGSIYGHDEDKSIPFRFTKKGQKKFKSSGLSKLPNRIHLIQHRRVMRFSIPDSKILLTSTVFENPYEIDIKLLKNLWKKDKINIVSAIINCHSYAGLVFDSIPYANHDKNKVYIKAYLETLIVESKR